MRRDYFTLEVTDIDWVDEDGEPQQPEVVIDFQGPASELREQFEGPNGKLLDAGETDVAFRLKGDVNDPETTGVVSVTNRVTGDFILELNEDAEDVLKFIRAARRYGKQANGDGRYRVEVSLDGDELVTYEKTTFLVYNEDGDLLRQHSLIPSGVEL